MQLDLEALRADLVPTTVVKVAEGKEFAVSGLHLDGILTICRRHWTDAGALFEKFLGDISSPDGTISLEDGGSLGSAVLGGAPRIAAEIIACAAGYSAPEAVDIFAELSFAVQLDALEKIAELTFTSEMPPKKVIEIVARTLAGVAKPLTRASVKPDQG